MVSFKRLLKQIYRPNPRNLKGAAQDTGTSGSGGNNGGPSASLDSNQPVAPSTSIQRLFPGNNIYNLIEVHVPDNAIVDIVFLHGLTGCADTTFLHKETGTFWPVDLLPNEIDNARVLTFGYDVDVAKLFQPVGQNNLQSHAKNLMNDLARKRENTASVSRKIIFVAHSLGGLVVKKTLALSENSADEHLTQIARHTVGIAFLGTPHRGSDLAPFAKAVANIVKASTKRINANILGVLNRNSETLADVEDSFMTWLRRYPGRCELTCFFEELEFRGIGMVVEQESAYKC
ncbi:hypothetical protein F5Y13DRAFT_169107 [Hypoxylon sp. FL1857]|nr:hypothetical protein F5Y13DRAFT_169107 [Hypoxylon sp. FL1857]